MLDMSKIGGRKSVPIPLGAAMMRGRIDFSKAAPKPEPRDIKTAQSDRRHKKAKEGEYCNLNFSFHTVFLTCCYTRLFVSQ